MLTKSSQFLWAHNDDPIRPDPFMTRDRAARMLRAWRRAKTQGKRVFLLKRTAVHTYSVQHVATGERGTMTLQA